MKNASTLESGAREKLVLDGSSPLSPAALLKRCHDILEAASSVLLNVEYLARDDATDRDAAVVDARDSLDRIVRVVRALQDAARSAEAREKGA